MSYQYIDGINNLYFQDGTIRGTLVIQESHFQAPETPPSEEVLTVAPVRNVMPVGVFITSIRGALQMRAALDALIKTLIDNRLIAEPDRGSSPLMDESLNPKNITLN